MQVTLSEAKVDRCHVATRARPDDRVYSYTSGLHCCVISRVSGHRNKLVSDRPTARPHGYAVNDRNGDASAMPHVRGPSATMFCPDFHLCTRLSLSFAGHWVPELSSQGRPRDSAQQADFPLPIGLLPPCPDRQPMRYDLWRRVSGIGIRSFSANRTSSATEAAFILCMSFPRWI